MGNVGIGTTVPGSRLEVTSGVETAGLLADTVRISSGGFYYGRLDIKTAAGNASGTPPAVNFALSGTGGTPSLSITGGNTGVGTTTPLRQLHVEAPANGNAIVRMAANSSGRQAVVEGVCNQVGLAGACASLSGTNVNVELGRFTIESVGGDNHTGKAVILVSQSGTLNRRLSVEPNGNLIIAGSLQQGGNPDIAENIRVSDPSIAAGHLVVADPDFAATAASPYERVAVTKSRVPYDAGLIGVVTSEPGMLLNADAHAIDTGEASPGSTRPFVLTGRVPVTVSTENGPIAVGDRITSSSVPGVGMKATKAGRVIGIALTAYAGKEPGDVLVLVNAHTWIPDDALARLNGE